MNAMNSYCFRNKGALLVCLLWFGVMASEGATPYYVATNGPGGAATSWATAKSNIQDAISLCSSGDTVWVSNGLYQTGGMTNYPTGTLLTNRVVLTKAITVRSLNGSAVTTIKGAWASAGNTNGWGAVRCVFMSLNSSLIGFMLTNGATLTTNESVKSGDLYCGGVFCQGWTTNYPGGADQNPLIIISNCVITGNAGIESGGAGGGTLSYCTLSGNIGGGDYNGVLYNCMVIGNTRYGYGGGLNNCIAANCTIVSNWAYTPDSDPGAGVYGGYLTNCISWNNNVKDKITFGRAYNSCGVQTTSGAYTNNNCITNNPLFVDSAVGNYRLTADSPCINKGTNQSWMTGAVDLDGRSRLDHFSQRVDMGVYEYLPKGTILSGR